MPERGVACHARPCLALLFRALHRGCRPRHFYAGGQAGGGVYFHAEPLAAGITVQNGPVARDLPASGKIRHGVCRFSLQVAVDENGYNEHGCFHACAFVGYCLFHTSAPVRLASSYSLRKRGGSHPSGQPGHAVRAAQPGRAAGRKYCRPENGCAIMGNDKRGAS